MYVQTHTMFGGIVGNNRGMISRGANFGNIYSDDQAVGGIAGLSGYYNACGYIFECANFGTISSKVKCTGGIVGYAGGNGRDSIAYIYNCYNAGTVTGGEAGAGIIGEASYDGGITHIYNCYNIGNVSDEEIIIKSWGNVIKENNYEKQEVTIEKLKITSNIEDQLKQTGTYKNDIWVEDIKNINQGYPILKWQQEDANIK